MSIFISQNRVTNSAIKCSFPHRKGEEQPNKKPKKGGDKNAVAIERCATVGLCISRHRAAGIFIDLTEGHKSLGITSTSTIHKSCGASSEHSRKQRSIAEKNTSQTSSSAQTERQERCARGDAWRLAKNIITLNEKDKATLFSPTHEWSLPAPSAMKPEEREFVVDAGASVHMLSRKDLNSAELETVKVSESPTTVVTANGKVQTEEEATVYVRDLDLFVTVMLLEDTPAVLSIGKLCEDHGYNYHWTSGQKPHLIKNGRKIDCNAANYVPFVAPGLSRSSSSSSSLTSPTSSSQEAATLTHHPASMRSESTSGVERVRGDPSRGPAKVKNPIKNEDNERVRGNPLRDLPEWLEEITENLVDDSVSEHRDAPASSSRELSSEPRAKVVSGKHSIFYSLPEGPKLRHLLENTNYAPCRKRTGTVVPRAELFGDLIAADDNVLSEGCESRHND